MKRYLGIIVAIVSFLVAFLGRGMHLQEAFAAAISVAVALIPEGACGAAVGLGLFDSALAARLHPVCRMSSLRRSSPPFPRQAYPPS